MQRAEARPQIVTYYQGWYVEQARASIAGERRLTRDQFERAFVQDYNTRVRQSHRDAAVQQLGGLRDLNRGANDATVLPSSAGFAEVDLERVDELAAEIRKERRNDPKLCDKMRRDGLTPEAMAQQRVLKEIQEGNAGNPDDNDSDDLVLAADYPKSSGKQWSETVDTALGEEFSGLAAQQGEQMGGTGAGQDLSLAGMNVLGSVGSRFLGDAFSGNGVDGKKLAAAGASSATAYALDKAIPAPGNLSGFAPSVGAGFRSGAIGGAQTRGNRQVQEQIFALTSKPMSQVPKELRSHVKAARQAQGPAQIHRDAGQDGRRTQDRTRGPAGSPRGEVIPV